MYLIHSQQINAISLDYEQKSVLGKAINTCIFWVIKLTVDYSP